MRLNQHHHSTKVNLAYLFAGGLDSFCEGKLKVPNRQPCEEGVTHSISPCFCKGRSRLFGYLEFLGGSGGSSPLCFVATLPRSSN